MRKILVISMIFVSSFVYCDEVFYIKITQAQAEQMEQLGLAEMFPGILKRARRYRSFILDEATGDRYYRIKNVQYKNDSGVSVKYNVVNWINNNYPQLTKYSWDYVYQFLPPQTVQLTE